jgi:hypothetical protein
MITIIIFTLCPIKKEERKENGRTKSYFNLKDKKLMKLSRKKNTSFPLFSPVLPFKIYYCGIQFSNYT